MITNRVLASTLKKSMERLVFRRAGHVTKGKLVSIIQYVSPTVFKTITEEEYNKLPEEVKERECELSYKEYSGMTTPTQLLTKTEKCGRCCEDKAGAIVFNSENYCELDFTNCDSSFFFNPNIRKLIKSAVPPRAARTIPIYIWSKEDLNTEDERGEIERLKNAARQNIALGKGMMMESLIEEGLNMLKKVKEIKKSRWVKNLKPTPIVADLICGVLDESNRFHYKWWFIASEQFFHFFKIIMHDNVHKCVAKSKLDQLSKVLNGSNDLTTNTPKKYEMKLEALNREFENLNVTTDWAEMAENFTKCDVIQSDIANLVRQHIYWKPRYEKCAQQYAHIYPALILLCVYKQELTEQNQPKLPWDVPEWLKEMKISNVMETPRDRYKAVFID
jgi:hypothetical protein